MSKNPSGQLLAGITQVHPEKNLNKFWKLKKVQSRVRAFVRNLQRIITSEDCKIYAQNTTVKHIVEFLTINFDAKEMELDKLLILKNLYRLDDPEIS